MSVILRHETDPTTALEIMRTRRFIAGPILGDAGLNACFINHPDGAYHPNQAERRGAILEFEWSGPVSSENYVSYPDRNVCYDQHPHRAFIFVGTTQHLRLVGLKPKEGWISFVQRPDFSLSAIGTWCRSRRAGWMTKQAGLIAAEVNSTLADKPPVTIVLPSSAPYLQLVRQRFPDIE